MQCFLVASLFSYDSCFDTYLQPHSLEDSIRGRSEWSRGLTTFNHPSPLFTSFALSTSFHECRVMCYDAIIDPNEQSPSETLNLSCIEKNVASKIEV
ncbi:unnamed protein product [Fusarium graminearum]|nr:unnamed protein product [Fusarium graminearum]